MQYYLLFAVLFAASPAHAYYKCTKITNADGTISRKCEQTDERNPYLTDPGTANKIRERTQHNEQVERAEQRQAEQQAQLEKLKEKMRDNQAAAKYGSPSGAYPSSSSNSYRDTTSLEEARRRYVPRSGAGGSGGGGATK